MRLIRIVLLIVLSIVLLVVAFKVDWGVSFFSITNLNCLFSMFICGILFFAIVILTEKLAKINKHVYPKAFLFWLFLSFGLLCFSLILLAYIDANNSKRLFMAYLSFLSNTFLCLGCLFAIRKKIRNNYTE